MKLVISKKKKNWVNQKMLQYERYQKYMGHPVKTNIINWKIIPLLTTQLFYSTADVYFHKE